MTETPIARVLTDPSLVGTSVTVAGWVRNKRESRAGIIFIDLSDGSCFGVLQVVAEQGLANFDDLHRITTGCSIVASGDVIVSPAKKQAVELHATQVEVVGWVDDPDSYPLAPKHHSFEFLREVAHLRVRTNTFGAVARVRNSLAMNLHRVLQDDGFVWINTPIITANDAEGAGSLFRVSTLDLANSGALPGGLDPYSHDFFGRPTFLTVSGQLDVESYCLGLTRVYTFGPTFRAENSHTPRHLAEFWMIEPEIAFADLLDNAMVAEKCLKGVFRSVLEERADDMAFFADRVDPGCVERLERLIEADFERMDYSEAVTRLAAAVEGGRRFEFPIEWGMELQVEHERYLTEELVGRPVVVMNYPKEIKAFYMRLNDDERTVAAMDVLAPGIGEIVGGSQREERLDVLDSRIRESGLDGGQYWWYRDLRRYGTVPHAGFGLGFERLIMYVTGLANIRDVIPFPRTPRNADF
ncbi:MAG: asparagine--tRNA ligase [Acidimicrobiales bacterium]